LENYGFSNWEEAFRAYKGQPPGDLELIKALTVRTSDNLQLKKTPPHVVLVVMESFGSYWNDQHSAEFNLLGELKQHFDKDYLFKNFLSAENGTIGSIVSVATSQVIRPGARFLSESEYMRTGVSSAGNQAFSASGYDTHFVYGGKLGWRDLGKYLKHQQYKYLWGADEIKESMPELNNFSDRDLGNEWGIFDEYLYGFIDEQLRTSTRPQFFLVLTTSNHPPYEYPSSYRPLPLKLDKEKLSGLTIDESQARKRFLGLQYANQKAGEFLTRMKSSRLSENTIVALTGDHSFWVAKGVGQDEEFKRYAVPFYLSLPDAYRPKDIDTSKFGSHEDIFPTLINLALANQAYVKLGEDLLHEDSFAINSSGLIANKAGAYHHGKFWKWKDIDRQILELSESTPELEDLKKRGLGQIGLTDIYLKNEKNRKQTVEENDLP
jgi:phosphoglycerol transferase MdoB-like AlkP superfamily enzyme